MGEEIFDVRADGALRKGGQFQKENARLPNAASCGVHSSTTRCPPQPTHFASGSLAKKGDTPERGRSSRRALG